MVDAQTCPRGEKRAPFAVAAGPPQRAALGFAWGLKPEIFANLCKVSRRRDYAGWSSSLDSERLAGSRPATRAPRFG